MSIVLRVFVVLFCVVLFLYVLRLVAREKLLLKYSLLWLALAIILLVFALFPGALFVLAYALGFEAPANFIFFIGLFCLMAITLSLTVIVSKQTLKIKNLTQRIALIEHNSLDITKIKRSDTARS